MCVYHNGTTDAQFRICESLGLLLNTLGIQSQNFWSSSSYCWSRVYRAIFLLHRPYVALDACRRIVVFCAHKRILYWVLFIFVAFMFGRFSRLAKFGGFPTTDAFFSDATSLYYGAFELTSVVACLKRTIDFVLCFFVFSPFFLNLILSIIVHFHHRSW